jgi:hypothetical protein
MVKINYSELVFYYVTHSIIITQVYCIKHLGTALSRHTQKSLLLFSFFRSKSFARRAYIKKEIYKIQPLCVCFFCLGVAVELSCKYKKHMDMYMCVLIMPGIIRRRIMYMRRESIARRAGGAHLYIKIWTVHKVRGCLAESAIFSKWTRGVTQIHNCAMQSTCKMHPARSPYIHHRAQPQANSPLPSTYICTSRNHHVLNGFQCCKTAALFIFPRQEMYQIYKR